MKAHLLEQVSLYGEQILVNLVNQKGHEQPVKEAYERFVSKVRQSIILLCFHIYEISVAQSLKSTIRILRFP